MSEDPIGFNAGDQNLYRYVFNNPINFNDPDGKIVLALPFIFGGGGAAALDFFLEFGLGTAVIEAGLQFAAEHTINTNPANLPKHQKVEAGKKRDQGNESADKSGTRSNKDKKKQKAPHKKSHQKTRKKSHASKSPWMLR